MFVYLMKVKTEIINGGKTFSMEIGVPSVLILDLEGTQTSKVLN